jgi:hypothetical protein
MAVRKGSNRCQLFRVFRGRALFVRRMMHPYFSVGPSRQREALVCCLDGLVCSPGISWRIFSLAKKTLHRHRAGFESQRASPFMKIVKAPQILRERSRPSLNDHPSRAALYTAEGACELYQRRSTLFEIVTLYKQPLHQDWGRARAINSRFTRDDKGLGPQLRETFTRRT